MEKNGQLVDLTVKIGLKDTSDEVTLKMIESGQISLYP